MMCKRGDRTCDRRGSGSVVHCGWDGLTGVGSNSNLSVIQHDRVLDDGQLLWPLLRGGEPRVERAQGCFVGGRRLAAALVVVGLSVEQQSVEPCRRVVL